MQSSVGRFKPKQLLNIDGVLQLFASLVMKNDQVVRQLTVDIEFNKSYMPNLPVDRTSRNVYNLYLLNMYVCTPSCVECVVHDLRYTQHAHTHIHTHRYICINACI